MQIAKEHLHGLVELKGDYVGVHQFRGQSAYYLKGYSHSARAKVAITSADTEAEMFKIMDDFVVQTKDREKKSCCERMKEFSYVKIKLLLSSLEEL